MPRVRLSWRHAGRTLEAVEPDASLVERHAEVLRDWYNAPENASMMEGSGAMTRDDVLDFWCDLSKAGGRGFLGFFDGEIVGDADLRGFRGRSAEFAVMIGDPRNKGRGIGRALSSMIHVYAFRDLRLGRLYLPVRRDNRRMNALGASLGYEPDDGQEARSFEGGPTCSTASVSEVRFRELHRNLWRDVKAEVVEAPL